MFDVTLHYSLTIPQNSRLHSSFETPTHHHCRSSHPTILDPIPMHRIDLFNPCMYLNCNTNNPIRSLSLNSSPILPDRITAIIIPIPSSAILPNRSRIVPPILSPLLSPVTM